MAAIETSVRQMESSATHLGILLPMFEPRSFVGRLAGMIDLFWIWWAVVLAIGLAALYKRRTGPIAAIFLSIYAVIAVVAAAVLSQIGGRN